MVVISQKNHSIECQFDVKKSSQNSNKNLQNIHRKLYSSEVKRRPKCVSARILMKIYSDELKKQLWGGHLWNPSYFIATVSENIEQQIINYIKNQKKK